MIDRRCWSIGLGQEIVTLVGRLQLGAIVEIVVEVQKEGLAVIEE
jgi:hypothetical protein